MPSGSTRPGVALNGGRGANRGQPPTMTVGICWMAELGLMDMAISAHG